MVRSPEPAAGPVIDWLLAEEQPSVRFLTLTRLLGRAEDDPEVQAAKSQIPLRGWAADLLARQDPAGWWVQEKKLYLPKYHSTHWMLLVLSDLGLTREVPGIEQASELCIHRFSTPDGGFGPDGGKQGHLCTTGNMARALVKLGFRDHPAVARAFEWLAVHRDPKGGWSCFGSGRNLDSWEPLSAFAVYPRELWTTEMAEAVRRGAEFFLERELHRQGEHYEPWYRFHYPHHYYYDLLVGLDCITALGYGQDPRLAHALGVLEHKRRPDGRWTLDAVHPDVDGKMAEWYARHPRQAPTPFALEQVGEPSRMITLIALLVLQRLGRVRLPADDAPEVEPCG